MKIISISGFIGSGKDTVADYLVQEKGFQRESFAATLKDAVASVFGWDRDLLEGRSGHAREWREQVDSWWAQRLDMPNLTPRWVLQNWGTEVCRQGFHDDIWIASLERRLLTHDRPVVISDARFPNEFRSLTRVGAKTLWVRRGPLPDWYSLAVTANRGHVWAVNQLKELEIHVSETAWAGHQFDWVIDNNGSLASLYGCIDDLLAER